MTLVQDKKKSVPFDRQRPFLGLRSFEEKNRAQFGGRDTEIMELFGLNENHGLTVVFGKSGIGKTSLIKAGLMPELRQNFYFPIYVRIDYSSSKTPLEQLRSLVFEEMKKQDSSVSPVGDETLWEYFHQIKLVDGLLIPVLILDQFEEIFTLGDGNKKDVRAFTIELADLAENRIPLVVQKEYRSKDETVPTEYADQPYRVVLSLREDYLARLEELKKYMPSIMANRFRVVQMDVRQALEAAVKPGKEILEEAVAREIIKKLPGIAQSDFDQFDQKGYDSHKLKVEPFLLSLICDRINERRIKKGLSEITSDLVSRFDVTHVIDSFYNEIVNQYGPEVRRAIEDRLLTTDGFRKLQAVEVLQGEYNISDEVLDELVGSRILRKEARDGVDYVELIHDVLAPVIKKSRDKRIEHEWEEKRRAAHKRIRERNRTKFIRRTSLVGFLIILIIGAALFTAIQKNRESEKALLAKKELELRNQKMALARNLLFMSNSLDSDSYEKEKAARIARIAYLLHDNNKNENRSSGDVLDLDDQFYYFSMYGALRSLGVNFQIAKLDEDGRSMAHVNPDEIYIGLNNGTIQKIKDTLVQNITKEALDSVESDSEYKSVVNSMALLNEDNGKLLAMAGTFDAVMIHNPESGKRFKKIKIANASTNSKYVEFTPSGKLILSNDSVLVGRDSLTGQPFKWHEREQFFWDDSTKTKKPVKEPNVKWGRSTLRFPGKVDGFSVYKDSIIAVGIDSLLVLLTRDEYLELRPPGITSISAIKFHPSGEYLILGDKEGEVLKMSMKKGSNYKTENYRSHTTMVTNIACSPDGKFVATASKDYSIVIWNVGNWNAPLPINSKDWYGELGRAKTITFSPDSDYVVAGYGDGTILKWPSSMETLEKLICEEVDGELRDEEWESLVKFKDLKKEDYDCRTNTRLK